MKKLFLLLGVSMIGTQKAADCCNHESLAESAASKIEQIQKSQEIPEIVNAWQNYFDTQSWQELIAGKTPFIGGCGSVYALSNALNRPGESIAIADMRNIAITQPHYHPGLEIYLILQGTALVTVGHETRAVKAGDVVIIPPFKAHYSIPDSECVLACINSPAYTPESYIPLTESNSSVDFDYDIYASKL
jgi:mannose-6-phosphate isomerase-like protein (cupin superfamily)